MYSAKPLFSFFAVLAAVSGCKAAHSDGGAATKDIEEIESGGVNTAGTKMFVVHCAEGWVHIVNGSAPATKVTITEDEFNAGNITKKYCTTLSATGGGTTPPPGPGPGPGTNTGTGGGGQSGAGGLAAIPKGFYIRTSGDLAAKMVQFTPVSQAGNLKRIDIVCNSNTALSGAYACSDNFNCKKADATLTFFDDHFEVEAGGKIGGYSTNALVLPSYVVNGTQDDQGTGTMTVEFTVSGKSPIDYTEAGMSQFCASLNVTPAGQIWGMRFNGAAVGTSDFPGTVQGARDWCNNAVKPRVIQEFTTWLNAN